MIAPDTISNADQECVSFLMTLKHRAVTPPLSSRRHPGSSSFTAETEVETSKNGQMYPVEESLNVSSYPSSNSGMSMPIATEDDHLNLSPSQHFVRMHCCEFFVSDGATATKAVSQRDYYYQGPIASTNSRDPSSADIVGIRCKFCKDAPPNSRAAQHMSFPSNLSGIRDAVGVIQRRHLPYCSLIPNDVKNKLNYLKESVPSNDHRWIGRQQYWVDSAKKVGLCDTHNGIRMIQDMVKSPPCFKTPSPRDIPSYQSKIYHNYKSPGWNEIKLNSGGATYDSYKIPNALTSTMNSEQMSSSSVSCFSSKDTFVNTITAEKLVELIGDTELVEMQDKDLVPDYLFVAMAQMQPCSLTYADRVGCYKDREIGFVGMSCKHCGGQPGFGKYFPATMRSLAQTTTSQTIVKHIAVKCRACPPEIRLAVVTLQNDQLNQDKALKDTTSKGAFDSRPRYGSRKIFFQRLWSRLHGGELPVAEPAVSPQERPTVVSPQLDESVSYPQSYHDRWSSGSNHHAIKGEQCNDYQPNDKIHSSNLYRTSHVEKRSRAVSYVHEEDGLPRLKMSRMVSNHH